MMAANVPVVALEEDGQLPRALSPGVLPIGYNRIAVNFQGITSGKEIVELVSISLY